MALSFSLSSCFFAMKFIRQRHNQTAELLLCHLYLTRFHRQQILERRQRAARVVDAWTQTEPGSESPNCGSSSLSSTTCFSGGHLSAPEQPAITAPLLEATPVIQPGTVSTTNGFLDPLVRRMPTAPRKLGNKPRVKANVLRDVPVVPSMILSKKAPVTTGHLRVN